MVEVLGDNRSQGKIYAKLRVRPLVYTRPIAMETIVSLSTVSGKYRNFQSSSPENDFHACPYSISRFSNRIVYS